MNLPLYDAHNHLQDHRLARDRGIILQQLTAIGLKGAVVNGTREEDWNTVLELTEEDPRFIPSLGLHPWHVSGRSPDWEAHFLEKLTSRKCAVGEIGLDRWIKDYDEAAQQDVFLRQLSIAAERNLPVTIHCLKAWGKLLVLLQANPLPDCGFLLHSYGGPVEMVDSFLQLGGYFSFSGYFAHPRKARQRDVFAQVPLKRLLLETDAPDMLPPEELISFSLPSEAEGAAPNSPANLAAIYDYVAQLRGVDRACLADAMENNFRTLFGPVIT